MSEQTYSVPPAVLAAIQHIDVLIPSGSTTAYTPLLRYLARRGYSTITLAEIEAEQRRRGIPADLVHRARAMPKPVRAKAIAAFKSSQASA